jgi:hypothetical protein
MVSEALKCVFAVQFREESPIRGLASIKNIQNSVFEKPRKTQKKRENQRNSLVFRLASIKTVKS